MRIGAPALIEMAENLFSVLHFQDLISFSEEIGKNAESSPRADPRRWSVVDLIRVVQNLYFRLANMLIRV